MRVLGHRGSRRPGPENTLAAIVGALAAGLDGVEIDARRTADGAVVLSHDPVTADGRTVVASRGDELALLPLADALTAVAGRGQVVVEIKNIPGDPDFDAPAEATADLVVALLADLRTAVPDADLLVSSFDWFAIERVRDALDGAVPTAFLVPNGVAVADAAAYAGPAGHRELHVPVRTLLDAPDDGAAAIAAAAGAGLGVVAWTVEEAGQATRLRSAGVAGVIVDDPAAVLAELDPGA